MSGNQGGAGLAGPETGGQRGFALILALWMSALTAVLVIGFLASTRSHHAMVSHLAGEARAKALAEGAIHHMIHALLDPARAGSLHFGEAIRVDIGSGTAVVRLENEAGKVDLRAATPGLIRAVLSGCAYPLPDTDRLLAAIGRTRATGAGSLGPLHAIADLAAIVSLSPGDSQALSRLFTVHSGMEEPVSPYPGPIDGAVTAWYRAQNLSPPQSSDPSAPIRNTNRIQPRHDLIAVTATTDGPGSSAYSLRAVIRLTPGMQTPYIVLAWHRHHDPAQLGPSGLRCTQS